MKAKKDFLEKTPRRYSIICSICIYELKYNETENDVEGRFNSLNAELAFLNFFKQRTNPTRASEGSMTKTPTEAGCLRHKVPLVSPLSKAPPSQRAGASPSGRSVFTRNVPMLSVCYPVTVTRGDGSSCKATSH